jgi:hypothetical protein
VVIISSVNLFEFSKHNSCEVKKKYSPLRLSLIMNIIRLGRLFAVKILTKFRAYKFNYLSCRIGNEE